jgi:hypothetical protein
MFKNISGSGKTWVHASNCPHLGLRTKFQACEKLNCTLNHAADSCRTGLIQMLRQAFSDFGFTGPWSPSSRTGNPVNSKLVTDYLRMLQEQQAAAGVTQKQAAILLRDQTHKLVQSMISYLSNPNLPFKDTFDTLRDLAIICLAFSMGTRGDDMGNLLTTQIIDFPNIKGKIFAFQLGKTLRDGSTNAFGILPDKLYPVMCPIRRLDKFLKFCETHNLAMEGNRIFTKLNVNKTSINDNNPSR